ncbi:MAG TPA: hypothetical protein VGW33_13715 [Terriglobia bacterium]|nr:hypothetical protein [Terriglobia bacterium]
MQKDSRGFSWVELLLIIVIVVLCLAIALPSITKSRADLNTMEAMRDLHRVMSAETSYAGTYNTGYSPALSSLGPPPGGMPTASAAGFIDSDLSAGSKEGYTYVYSPGPRDSDGKVGSFTVTASPTKLGSTGKSYYFMDQTGVIRMNGNSTASASDSAVGG